MATELGVAYISIVPETSRIAPGIRNALNGAERGAGDTGRRMGHTMSTALGTALGIGVSKAAGAASKVLQDALSAGYNRITTLEKADIQFRNMGLSAGDTKRQLADLNDIVTGTSTSLADAAAAAAMLGGAGVAAGDDMNNAVKALVNISAASGASAQDIGLVMMQIKASGKLMGSEALQLAQRGVPIYDLIAKSIGKTTAEVRTSAKRARSRSTRSSRRSTRAPATSRRRWARPFPRSSPTSGPRWAACRLRAWSRSFSAPRAALSA
ncbi:tape measure protein [Gordonia westfalica]|uniref:Tape measure domain-containing protein n=1 Tax=Gordonia westfalica TaxID=158898 RepID=A0A1H2DQN6_9ACTN|nr:tape measure protein [Gordonia westfalica]SDT85200.1 tape measure domain-containing protein [Gordonia westfalica]